MSTTDIVTGCKPTILVQSYHAAATAALIRDFKTVGFHVVSPDSDWGRISWFSSNDGLGGEPIGYDEYMKLPPSYLLVGCKPQEEDLKAIARTHGDKMILNVAQHLQVYEEGISDILICPDIQTFEQYPQSIKHKLLYFPRPFLSYTPQKNVDPCYYSKRICSFVSMPQWWPAGTQALDEFALKYPYECRRFGHAAPDGLLDHKTCNIWMSESFLTVHFKEHEAYGLSCLESMMLGTPIVSLERFMGNKTLGRFFLNEQNAIVTKTVDEALDRVRTLTLEEYRLMSINCRRIVYDLTKADVTTDVLRYALYGTASPEAAGVLDA